MLGRVFSFWIGLISSWVTWLFTLKINENPDITIGTFLLACAFIGLVLYFLLGAEFMPFRSPNAPHINVNRVTGNKNSSNNSGYQPRHGRKE